MKKLIIMLTLVLLPFIAQALTFNAIVDSLDTGTFNGTVQFGPGNNPYPDDCQPKYQFSRFDPVLAMQLSRSEELERTVSITIEDVILGDGIKENCTIRSVRTID